MSDELDTAPGTSIPATRPASMLPGVVRLFQAGDTTQRATPLLRGRVVIGRRADGPLALEDDQLSRDHVEIRRGATGWTVVDLGSRNGTFLDGAPLERERVASEGAIVRIGRSVLMLCDDIRPWEQWQLPSDKRMVIGPRTQPLFESVVRAAKHGHSVLVGGETGTGKELVVAAYHAASARKGRQVAINCAALPAEIAERLLFGARRGAYSGAVDAEGLFTAADGGTVFLDEIGELDAAVQAKLLRVLETSEVLALGATRPDHVDVRVCSATHRDLAADVDAGVFRQDLYYRIARVRVRLLPLRERREEIPLLMAHGLARLDTSARLHARLVEHCLLQAWRGNVRELLGELDCACSNARDGDSEVVRVEHLPQAELRHPAPESRIEPESLDPPTLAAALERHQGNLAATARALGLHRTQLYRLLDRHGMADRRRG